jgi:hypothetical protein
LSFNSVGYLILTLAKIQSHCLIDQCKDPLINAWELLQQELRLQSYWLKPVRHNKVKWISIFPPIPATFLLRVAKGKQLGRNNLRLRHFTNTQLIRIFYVHNAPYLSTKLQHQLYIGKQILEQKNPSGWIVK